MAETSVLRGACFVLFALKHHRVISLELPTRAQEPAVGH